LNGALRVHTMAPVRSPSRPIDTLLASLALDQGAASVGMVLSGMGSDGSTGMKAIAEAGGLCLVQQPDTAAFDSMPCAALEAVPGCTMAPPEALVARVLAARRARPTDDRSSAAAPDMADAVPADDPRAFEALLSLLHLQQGHDFREYKRSTLQRRVARRVALHGHATLAAYVAHLAGDAQEQALLFKELLIGVTRFFRDAQVWQHLQSTWWPQALAAAEGRVLRAWLPGCSTGEEAYSMAIAFAEVLQQPGVPHGRLQIFATDLNPDAIDRARRGRFPRTIEADVSAERLQAFFTPTEDGWRVRPAIRDMVVFAPHDLTRDPPFTQLDLVCCRNLLIYFKAPLQQRLLMLFHFALRPGGSLLLGPAETIGRADAWFAPIDEGLHLFRRLTGRNPAVSMHFAPAPPGPTLSARPEKSIAPVEPTEGSFQSAVDHLLLSEFSPAALVVNPAGDILHVSGRTGRFLEPAAGRANWNVHAMARDGLRGALAEALRMLPGQLEPVELRGLAVHSDAGLLQVDVSLRTIEKPADMAGMVVIVFREAPARPAAGARRRRGQAAAVDAELRSARAEAAGLREQMRLHLEELQAANEELMSSKEEVQSMNEELQTINAELQAKVDALGAAQNDLNNLLASSDIATLFLDTRLNVRRFTEQATRVVNLRPGDIGRPLADLTMRLAYPELLQDVRDTLQSLKPRERQLAGDDGHWFSVRVMPYRTLDNVIDGAVITFVDIGRKPPQETPP